MVSIQHLREQANECRRLARAIYRLNDPTKKDLDELAGELDTLADAIETAEQTE